MSFEFSEYVVPRVCPRYRELGDGGMARIKLTNLTVENVKPPNSGRKEIRDTEIVGAAGRFEREPEAMSRALSRG